MPLQHLLELFRRYDGPVPPWEREALVPPLARARGRVVFWEVRLKRAKRALERGQAGARADLDHASENLHLAEATARSLEVEDDP